MLYPSELIALSVLFWALLYRYLTFLDFFFGDDLVAGSLDSGVASLFNVLEQSPLQELALGAVSLVGSLEQETKKLRQSKKAIARNMKCSFKELSVVCQTGASLSHTLAKGKRGTQSASFAIEGIDGYNFESLNNNYLKGLDMKIQWFLLLILGNLSFAAQWDIDSAHASARFKIRHMMVSNVSGEITGMKGTFTVDDKDANKMVLDGTLDMNSINTNNIDRDNHLKAADFFDVKKFPKATFKTKSITKGEGDKVTLVGELNMHGVSKEVTVEGELTPVLKDPFGKMRRGISGATKVNRKDFGLTWNKTLDNGGLALGDTVEINLEIELTQPAKDKKG